MCNYLTDMPSVIMSEYGISKVLMVRRESIHIKHIFTEIFVRKTIDIEWYLNKINWSLFDYMEYMTNRIRKVYHFNRLFNENVNEVVKKDRDNFFPFIELTKDLNTIIALDFDGVVTKKSFNQLYELCVDRCNTVICSANPTIESDWFIKNNLPLPNKIYSNKGKIKKIIKLSQLNLKHDYVFYVDDELEYLEFAWLFGIHTYQYIDNKIKYFTLKTK